MKGTVYLYTNTINYILTYYIRHTINYKLYTTYCSLHTTYYSMYLGKFSQVSHGLHG